MYDKNGIICGIRLRNSRGFKWAVSGSRQGVFLPTIANPKIAYLPEGPTDCAALLSIGLFPIGRPTANAATDILISTLKRLKIWQAVIVADNDNLKFGGVCARSRPGLTAAQKLKKQLPVKSVIWVPPPPCKDIRDFVRKGGTKEMIEGMIEGMKWSAGREPSVNYV
jgi:hypothetical protein